MEKTQQYSMRVFWSDEDESFIAVCPEFQDLSAFGDTYEDAVHELKVAIGGAIEIYREEGWALPERAVAEQHSGQFRVRIPRSLHSRLVSDADRENVSLNTLVVARLAERTAEAAAARELNATLQKTIRDLQATVAAMGSTHVRAQPMGVTTTTANLMFPKDTRKRAFATSATYEKR